MENQPHLVGLDGFEMHTVMPAPIAMQALAPRTGPLLLTDAAAADSVEDKTTSKCGWFPYILSLACCCLIVAVAIGFGAGFVLPTQSKIAAGLKVVAGSCANVTVYEKVACQDGFLSCDRWPTQSERNKICADVSHGRCKAAVKERDVKDVFDLLCSDYKRAHIQEEVKHHHGRHHGHHGHHWHFNSAILYASKVRTIKYMAKWFVKHRKHHAQHHDGRHGKHHGASYDYYYDYSYGGAEELGKTMGVKARKEFRKRWFYKKWMHAWQKSEFQV